MSLSLPRASSSYALLLAYPRSRVRSSSSIDVGRAVVRKQEVCQGRRWFATAAAERLEVGDQGQKEEGDVGRVTMEEQEEDRRKVVNEDVEEWLTQTTSKTNRKARGFAYLIPRPPPDLFPSLPNSPKPSMAPSTSQLLSSIRQPRRKQSMTGSDLVTHVKNLKNSPGELDHLKDSDLKNLVGIVDFQLKEPSASGTIGESLREELRNVIEEIKEIKGIGSGKTKDEWWNSAKEERIGLSLPRRILRSVTEQDVLLAERSFHTLVSSLPPISSSSSPNLQHQRSRFILAYINHLLHLCSLCKTSKSQVETYDRLYGFLGSWGLEPDARTWCTRVGMIDGREKGKGNGGLEEMKVIWEMFLKNEIRKEEKEEAMRSGNGVEEHLSDGVLTEPKATGTTTRKRQDDRIAVLNMISWAYAKRGRWDFVGPLYRQLLINASPSNSSRSDTNLTPFPIPTSFFSTYSLRPPLPIPPNLLPDQITFQQIIRSLAYHGNLKSALLVIQDMIMDEREYKLTVSDFTGIFLGFAKYGAVQEKRGSLRRTAGRPTRGGFGMKSHTGNSAGINVEEEREEGKQSLVDLVGGWQRHEAIRVESVSYSMGDGRDTSHSDSMNRDGGIKPETRSTFSKLTEIWAEQLVNHFEERASGPTGNPPEKSINNRSIKAENRNSAVDLDHEWSLSTLERLFTSFLSLVPPSLYYSSNSEFIPPSLAPTPRAVFQILLSFARTTGDDEETLKSVWQDLKAKFGEGNRQGWVGWRVDARLKRIVEGWEEDGAR